MSLRPGARALVEGVPSTVRPLLGLEVADEGEAAAYDHIHLFVTSRAEQRARMVALREVLAPRGRLWLSWPKGGGLGTDLSLPSVIATGYDLGLVESTCLSIDATWSALRFTWPRPGVIYANSYGTLPGQAPVKTASGPVRTA
ncbi:hypothetical protein GCM10027425_14340 [Alteromonas gracilis]